MVSKSWDPSTSGFFLDKHAMLSSLYDKEWVFKPPAGRMLVGPTGTVTLAWGGQCVLLIPTDETIIY